MVSALLMLAGWQVLADPSVYQVGDRVWGRYRNGRWYPARVAEARGDGRYMLNWDDGDPQDRIKGLEEVFPEPALRRVVTAQSVCPSSSVLLDRHLL